MNFGNNINLNLNELQNALAHKLGTNPVSGTTAQIWYNTTTNKLMYRDNVGDRDITYLAQVLALRLDQFTAPNVDVNMGSQKLTSLGNGTANGDAVNYGQLLDAIAGLQWKDAVRAATTANITLSGAQTIDGVSVIAGDRVLVKAQSTGADNGIYVAAAGAWARSSDANISAEVKSGMAMFITEGTLNGNTQYQLTTDNPITLGSTALTFAQFGASTTYTNGTGISIVGSVINIDTTLIPRKYAATIGDAIANSFVLTHNLGTRDVIVSVQKISTFDVWTTDVQATTTNTTTVAFAFIPTTNEYRVTIHAAG